MRRFFVRARSCGHVKVVYCDHCQDVSLKARLERDVCTRCGRSARPVPYSRPWQYYASSGILLAIVAVLLLLPIPSLFDRIAILLAGFALALGLTAWSMRSLRSRVLRHVQAAKEAEP